MSNPANRIEKSRLGRLLVNRGYINESQLQFALEAQRSNGLRLGEVLVSRGWVTQREIERTLKHQKRYRYAAAFAAMVATPLQPLVAFAASAPAMATMPTPSSQQRMTPAFQPLSDAEMARVSGQGIDDFLGQINDVNAMANGDKAPDSVEVMKVVARTFMPVFNMLDAEVNIQGVHYDPADLNIRFWLMDTSRWRCLRESTGSASTISGSRTQRVRVWAMWRSIISVFRVIPRSRSSLTDPFGIA